VTGGSGYWPPLMLWRIWMCSVAWPKSPCGKLLPSKAVDDDVLSIMSGRHRSWKSAFAASILFPTNYLLSNKDAQLNHPHRPTCPASRPTCAVAIIVLMAQIGSFVPASRPASVWSTASLPDWSPGGPGGGQSTFMVEMVETANILTMLPRSLMILDEIGRGTSTYDVCHCPRWRVYPEPSRLGARPLFALIIMNWSSWPTSCPCKELQRGVTEGAGQGGLLAEGHPRRADRATASMWRNSRFARSVIHRARGLSDLEGITSPESAEPEGPPCAWAAPEQALLFARSRPCWMNCSSWTQLPDAAGALNKLYELQKKAKRLISSCGRFDTAKPAAACLVVGFASSIHRSHSRILRGRMMFTERAMQLP